MAYKCTQDCLLDLEKHGHLVSITEEVDPYLEMAAIHRRVYDVGGPAIWFKNVKGTHFTAASNIFGTMDRCRFIFRDTLEKVKKVVQIKADPEKAMKKPWQYWSAPFTGLNALPMRTRRSAVLQNETTISQLPQIHCWPMDGGAYVTLPQVYTENIDKPGVMNANMGMYRVQLSGNNFVKDQEIGLHYQIHRGIGVHQALANAKGQPLRVCIFVGGPPAHTLAAVMPLPEGLSEALFAGALSGRRFRYTYKDGFCISNDADFVISGYVYPQQTKPEGPFGDHLGYYSLTHDFPLMKINKVWHRSDAVWPFTIVGRPPQEDTSFGELIHDITGAVVPSELPGLHAVNAVDAAGVHPLLLAIGSERYTPYLPKRQPLEILTIANHILGFGQMSLAKYLIICAKEDEPNLDIHDIPAYFQHVLARIDWTRDLHFQTKTSMDTLDYSGTGINSGSKVVMAAAGDPIRTLANEISPSLTLPNGFYNPQIVMPGILAIKATPYTDAIATKQQMERLTGYLQQLPKEAMAGFPLIIVVDDSDFTAKTVNNFLWVCFTRSNPSHDIFGVDSFTEFKHWGCRGSLVIDARIKPHHAPPLVEDAAVEKRVDALGANGGSLHGII